MRSVISSLATVMFVIVGAVQSWAAESQAPLARRPPPEVGVGLGRLFPTYGDFVTDDSGELNADMRITLPFTPRFAFEAIGTIGQRGNEFWQRTEGLYLLQVRQRLRRAHESSFQPFITYGATGYYAHVTRREVRIPQQGGGILTYPAVSYNETEAPYATIFGGGVQQRLTRHLAVRADAQLVTLVYLPVGLRLSTSVSIPLRATR